MSVKKVILSGKRHHILYLTSHKCPLNSVDIPKTADKKRDLSYKCPFL